MGDSRHIVRAAVTLQWKQDPSWVNFSQPEHYWRNFYLKSLKLSQVLHFGFVVERVAVRNEPVKGKEWLFSHCERDRLLAFRTLVCGLLLREND